MLDLTFYKENDVDILNVSEESYEKLAKDNLSKVVLYQDTCIMVDDEQYQVYAAKLDFDTRFLLLKFIEKVRQRELEAYFREIPIANEIQSQLDYVKVLTEMYTYFVNEKYLYFSF